MVSETGAMGPNNVEASSGVQVSQCVVLLFQSEVRK